jgi:pilus assembly protein TadC
MNASAGAWMLGAGWGVVLAAPVARSAGRVAVVMRAAALSTGRRSSSPDAGRVRRRVAEWKHAHADDPVLRVARSLLFRRREQRADQLVARELPVAIDLLGVAVGAGCTPFLALDVAARWSPPPLADVFREVLRRCALGLDFEAALDTTMRAAPRVRPLADALLASDRLGVPVGPVLARLADEDRTALRRAAEAHARRIPVRLLFPLVFLVLPAFVLLTVVPGLAAGLGRL